jgi:hypothetical protein
LVDTASGASPRIPSAAGTAEIRQQAQSRLAPPRIVSITGKGIEQALWTASTVVIGLGILDQILRRTRGMTSYLAMLPSFNFNAESSIPAWYSSMLMAAAALLLLAIAASTEGRHRWRALAVVFFCLSADEAISIHERLVLPIREALGLSGFLYFSWVVAAAPLLVLGALYFRPLVNSLQAPVRMQVIVSGTVFVAGAFGFELVGGYVTSAGLGKVAIALSVTAEEILEITGLTLFLSALVNLLARPRPPVAFRFAAGPDG